MHWLATTSLLGSPLLHWAIGAGIALAVFLTLLLSRRLIAGRLGRRAASTAGGLDDIAVDLARRTRTLLILVPAVWLGSLELQVSPAVNRVLKGAAEVAVFLQLALWASLAIDLWVARAQRRRLAGDASSLALVGVLRFVAKLTLWVILLLAALDNLGVNVTSLVTGLGIGGLAMALALQNVLSDLLASLAIVFDKPFVIGDSISVNELSGSVESIGLKTTRLRGTGGEQIILANGELLKSRIHNWKRMSERRVVLAFGVPHETPADVVAGVPERLRAIVEAQAQVRFERAHFKGFGRKESGETSLDFEAIYWIATPDYKVFMDCQQAVNLALLKTLQEEGIGLAAPSPSLLRPMPADRNLPPARS
ncbi:MAG TPA: mechanosensitive ion channel family protein [Thermoanaerobaculia bacterium]|jgi:small-conductance mechanosensitive channel|nr:mechanosensitive ion channel family protein [Thermoanaerobaculia bacterium]